MSRTPPSVVSVVTRLFIPAGCVALAGAFVAVARVPVLSFGSAGVLVALLGGAVLALLGVLLNLRWLWALVTTRRALISLNVWTQIILCFMLLFIANAIAAMTPQLRAWRLDCTYTRRHSISQQTVNLLGSIEKPLRVTVIMGDGTARYGAAKGQVVPVAERLADTLELYDGASGMVTTRTIDFDREKDECLRLRNQLEEPLLPNSILLQYEKRQRIIPFNLLVKPAEEPAAGGMIETVVYDLEARLTEAIQSVTEKSRATLYVLTGHDEFAADGGSDRAMTAFAAALRSNNYAIKKLSLRLTPGVPDDCRVLIIADPVAAVPEEEMAAIREYVDTGGNLFLLLNSRRPGTPASEFVAMLGRYNVIVRNLHVVWELHEHAGRIRQRVDPVVFANRFGAHPVTEGLQTLFVRADFASPLATTEEAAKEAGLKPPPAVVRHAITPLVFSSQTSWARPAGTPPTQDEIRGESRAYPIAMAVERARPPGGESRSGSRMVVCGCANIVVDQAFSVAENMGNRVFAVNAVNWLAHKEHQLGIPPQSSGLRPLTVSNRSAWRVFYLTVIAMPIFAACAGFVAWWRRRSA